MLRRIGSGSYGEVWLARNVLGTYRAVKIVCRSRFDNERPFEREFEGIKKFEPISRSHESQVDILQVGRGEGYFYYVMELADDVSGVGSDQFLVISNQFDDSSAQTHPLNTENCSLNTYEPKTLRREIQQRGRLSFDECLRISLSLTTALAHLHKHGLIHRDIKPSNIIFVHGVPKLADIGLVTDLDATMSFVGTEGFLPPEGRGSVQADIYSLGKVFYEMATGKDRLDFPEPMTCLAELPDREPLVEFNEVVLKACASDPRHRYQTAEELHSELVLLQAGKSLKRARWLERRLALATRAGFVAGIVALVAIGFSYQAKRAERQALEQTYRVHVAQGVRSMDDGDLFGSVLWFAKALNLGHHDRGQDAVNRWRIGTTLSFCPTLSQVVFHEDMVRRAVFSPDGRWIATASDDRTARVWDAQTGQPITPPLRHEAEVRDVEFSPDGRWLVTASNDHSARVWDAATGAPISPRLTHTGYVYRATFHPNGLFVGTASEDRTARIWDAKTGEPIGSPMPHDERILCVRFSPDGSLLATSSHDGTARIWRTHDLVRTRSTASLISQPRLPRPTGEDGENQKRPRVSIAPPPQDLQPQGEVRDDVESVPTDSTNRAVLILQHAGRVEDIAFSSDGRRLATASDDRSARVWDARTGAALTPPLKHNDEVWCVAFSPDGRLVATGSKDYTARIWDAQSGEARTPPLPHRGNLRTVEFSADGNWLATASSDRTARVWNVADGKPASPPLWHASNGQSASFDAESNRLITASRDGTARVWALAPPRSVELRLTNEITAFRVAVSPDGKRLAVRQWDPIGQTIGAYVWKPALLWNLESPSSGPVALRSSQVPGATWVGFSPDGNTGVTGGFLGHLQLWDGRTGRSLAALSGFSDHVWCAAFSPDGRFLVTGCNVTAESPGKEDLGQVWFWDVANAQPLGAPVNFPETVRHVVVSQDGHRVAAACWASSERATVQVWDVKTRRAVGPTIHIRGRVAQLTFSPDSQRLVTGSSTEDLGPCEAQVWNFFTGTPAAPPIKHRDGVQAASFSPDGNWILTASEDTTARVWDSLTSEPRTPPLQHAVGVQWAEFSPDGRLVLTASYDKTARVWDASTGHPLTPPLSHDGPVWHAVFSMDGLKIVTASGDRTARIWKLSGDARPASQLLGLAELLTGREIDPTGGLVPLDSAAIRAHWQALRPQ